MLGQKGLDLARRHAAAVQRHDLVVEPREAPLMLRDEKRLEAALAVARHLDAQRAVLGQDSLSPDISSVAGRRPRAEARFHR